MFLGRTLDLSHKVENDKRTLALVRELRDGLGRDPGSSMGGQGHRPLSQLLQAPAKLALDTARDGTATN